MPAKTTIIDYSEVILARLEAYVSDAVDESIKEGAQMMRDEMNAGKSGRNYGGHIASAPGEAPANWHDVLLDTIDSEMTGPTSGEFSAGGEEAPYLADWLEHGSPGGRIAPRPMVQPAADAIQPIFIANVSQAVKEALR
jgi:hypothetical protein